MTIVDETRDRLRGISPGDPSWRAVHYEAMLRAHKEGDRSALVGLSTLVAARLLSNGEHEEALSHLDFALGCAELSDDRAHILAVRSGALLSEGAVVAADAAIAEARDLEGLTDERRLELEIYAGTADCGALRAVDSQGLIGLALRAESQGHEHWCSGLLRWLIPAMFAAGRDHHAMPIVDLLNTRATTSNHPSRLSDVDLFCYAYSVPRGDQARVMGATREPHTARPPRLR